jgi:hypothetical protein
MIESEVARMEGVDFQTLVDGRCALPEAGQVHSLHLGLRVTNRTDQPLLFCSYGLQLRADSLHDSDGHLLPHWSGSWGILPYETVHVPTGGSHIFVVRGKLCPHKGAFGLSGLTNHHWYYYGLNAGKYRLGFHYCIIQRGESFWMGEVRAPDAELEITPLGK